MSEADDYDDIDVLIDTDPIALADRCRRAEAEIERLRSQVERVRAVLGDTNHHFDFCLSVTEGLPCDCAVAPLLAALEGGE